MSTSASGTKSRSTGMPPADLLLHGFPGQRRCRIVQKGLFSTCQFLLLPIMNRDNFRRTREIVPKVFHELKLFCRAQIEDGGSRLAHLRLFTDLPRRFSPTVSRRWRTLAGAV